MDLTNKKILIAEDVYPNFKLLKELLHETNAEILHAKNGKEAFTMFKELGNFDLVLMDIRMPLMDGTESALRIKEIDPLIPIIAQTAYGFDEYTDDFLDTRFDGFLSKPIRKDELIKAVGRLIENQV